MSGEIDKILKKHMNEKCVKIVRDKLLQELYLAMGCSIPARDAEVNLAIYLRYKHKNCDLRDPLKPVLRAALQAMLAIANEDVEKEIKLLTNLPDVDLTDDYDSYAAKLDEMIALKIFNLVGRIGIVKIAVLESREKIEERLRAHTFLKENGKIFFLRKLQIEINRLSESLENGHERAIDTVINQALKGNVGVTELRPLRDALTLLKNFAFYQDYQQMPLLKENHDKNFKSPVAAA